MDEQQFSSKGKMTDTELYIQRLLETNPLREPLLREIIQALELPIGSHGLDAGCGIGLQSLLLADAAGPSGHITGLDILPELLAYAKEVVGNAELSDRITFQEGDVSRLSFEDNSFDWIWSADCIGYPAGELGSILHELIRVLKPGGRIVLLGWSSQQLLPGYSLLEARLNGTCSGYLPFLKDKRPESNFMRAISTFRNIGLQDIQTNTFVRDVQSPLGEGECTALTSLFEMLWGTPQPDVSPEDWSEYQRLCKPTSPDFILNIPGYYAFFTYTVFQGTVIKH
jgi:demethylmenaquinone methyltransferase/2-methoxy-6-polyprenyl-1,4-benzoquinol methylase